MDKEIVKQKIENTLFEIITLKDKPEIIFAYIDTTYVADDIAPFLNIYGLSANSSDNFESALQIAEETEDEGYIWDVLQENYSSSFDIDLSTYYPQWPENLAMGDKEIISVIESFLEKQKQKTKHIKKVFFYYADCFDFTKIIDKY